MSLPKNFFARPDDNVRIDFARGPMGGTWIRIRNRISDAQAKRLTLGMMTGMKMSADGGVSEMAADATRIDTDKMKLWVLRWGSADDDRGSVPTRDELETLLAPQAAQILAAIDAHVAEIEAEDELEIDPLPESGSESTGASRTRARRTSGADSTDVPD